jgi:hypothetical protein
MSEEIDFVFGGMRIRSMAFMPAGSMMICDASNKPAAIYSEDKGWRAVSEKDFQRASQLILSPEGMLEIARRVTTHAAAQTKASEDGDE